MPRAIQPRHGKYFVYMVQCSDGTYYTGSTSSLEARIKLHNAGNGAKYLRGKGPVELVYAKEYRYYKNALHGERNLKKTTRREKEALIRIYAMTPSSSMPMSVPLDFAPRAKSRQGDSHGTFGETSQ